MILRRQLHDSASEGRKGLEKARAIEAMERVRALMPFRKARAITGHLWKDTVVYRKDTVVYRKGTVVYR